MKHILIIALFLVAISVISAPQKIATVSVDNNPWLKTPFEKGMKKPECDIDLDKNTYIGNLNNFYNMIEKGYDNGKPISSTHYNSFAHIVKSWTKLKYFECDTEISKNWLVKIAGMFQKMYDLNRAMDEAEAKKDTKKFEEYQKAFNKLVDLYVKEIQKPEKASQNVMQALEVQKMKEAKAYKAYLKKMNKGKDDGGDEE